MNDVYLGQRKLCGILTEGECAECGDLRYAVIGIGINTKKASHSPDVEAIMTSLEAEGKEVDVPRLAAEIVHELIPLTKDGESILEEYKARSMLIGRIVEISHGSDIALERVIDIDNECALVTECDDGSRKRYISGDVRLCPKKEDK